MHVCASVVLPISCFCKPARLYWICSSNGRFLCCAPWLRLSPSSLLFMGQLTALPTKWFILWILQIKHQILLWHQGKSNWRRFFPHSILLVFQGYFILDEKEVREKTQKFLLVDYSYCSLFRNIILVWTKPQVDLDLRFVWKRAIGFKVEWHVQMKRNKQAEFSRDKKQTNKQSNNNYKNMRVSVIFVVQNVPKPFWTKLTSAGIRDWPAGIKNINRKKYILWTEKIPSPSAWHLLWNTPFHLNHEISNSM